MSVDAHAPVTGAAAPAPSSVRRPAPRRDRAVVVLAPLALAVALGLWGIRRRNTMWGDESVTYLHHGIAQRAFKLSFRLADHIEVKAAGLQNGLLNIDLVRVVPEEAKAKRIPINGQRAVLEN